MDSRFSVGSMLSELSGYFKHRCEQKQIKLLIQCEDRLEIVSDRKRVLGVLFIFLDNAIKFSNKSDSTIRVVVEYCQ